MSFSASAAASLAWQLAKIYTVAQVACHELNGVGLEASELKLVKPLSSSEFLAIQRTLRV